MDMLSRLSAFLHQAAEQVLSDVTADDKDAFKAHWQNISEATTDNDGSITVIKEELRIMLQLLCDEEQQLDPKDLGTLGTCMEFLLRHRLFDTLYTSGKNDYPKGMGIEVLVFFTAILSQLERPLLHHVSILQPFVLQVKDCGMDPSSPLVIKQVKFIKALCLRLSREPSLVDAFLEVSEKVPQTFLLSDALLRLTNSCSQHTAGLAYECLMLCVALTHSSASAAIAAGKLPLVLASKLQYHFQLIPTNIVYTTILTCQVDLNQSPYSVLEQMSATFDAGHVEAFFFWLHYCECMVMSAQEPLTKAICENIHEIFLSASLLPKMVKVNEEDILVSTSILARSLQVTSCQHLQQEFATFALNDSSCVGDRTLKEMMASRLDHINEDVCQVTLHLLNSLLEADVAMVLRQLVGCQCLVPVLSVQEDLLQDVKTQLEELAVAYLSLLPDGLCSSMSVAGQTGLDQYYCDAYSLVVRSRELSASATTSQPFPDTTPTEKQLMECPWITMLLDKLESLLDQPFQVNLLVSSIFTKLAAAPFPVLDCLFQANYPEQNVYSILKKVAGTLQSRFQRTPGLAVHLTEARRRLAGEVTSDLLSMPNNNLLEGAILLEEFTKELSLVLVMKTTQSLLAP